MFLKGLLQMVSMEFTNVFNTEVVDNEKKSRAPYMASDPSSCCPFIVTGFVEAFVEKIFCQFASLWQAVASSENFELDPSIVGVSSEVLFFNEFLKGV